MYAFMCIFFTSSWTFINLFIKKKLFLKLKNNCFTESCWFLPNINMNFFFHPRRFTLFLCLRNSLFYESPHPVVKAHTHFVSLPCSYGAACDLTTKRACPSRTSNQKLVLWSIKHQTGYVLTKVACMQCSLRGSGWRSWRESVWGRAPAMSPVQPTGGTSGISSRQFHKLFWNVDPQRFCDLTDILQ